MRGSPVPQLPGAWENTLLTTATREVAEDRAAPANVGSTSERSLGSQNSLGMFQGEAGGQGAEAVPSRMITCLSLRSDALPLFFTMCYMPVVLQFCSAPEKSKLATHR